MTDSSNNLEMVVRESGLDVTSPKAKELLEQFSNYFDIAADWEQKAKSIVVTDAGQTAEMAMARTGRLFLREKRIAIEKRRKELKEQSLCEGKAIDGMANILKALIVPVEDYLEKQERFVEIKAAEEAERLRIEAERRTAEELRAKEEAEAKERERIRLENERLRKEAEQRQAEIIAAEKKLVEEKAKAEAAIKAAQAQALAEQERIERERKAERLAAEVESARIAKERDAAKLEVQREKAAAQAQSASIITCPHCGGTLHADGSKAR